MADDILTDQLAALAELHRSGSLSEEEFSAAKARILQGQSPTVAQVPPASAQIPPAPYIPAPQPQYAPSPQTQYQPPPPMYAPTQSWPPSSMVPQYGAAAPRAESATLPAIGMFAAAAGLLGAVVFRYSNFFGGFFDTNSDWWDKANLFDGITAAVLILCGVAMLQRPRAWPCAVALAPAAILGIEFVAATGDGWGLLSDGTTVAGWWSVLIGAGGSILVLASATRWVLRERWSSGERDAPIELPLLVATVAAGLVVAGALLPRYSVEGKDIGGLFDNSPEGWGLFFAVGIVAVSVCAPYAAALLHRTGPSAGLALGAALAVFVWDGPRISAVVFGDDFVSAATGFAVLLGGAFACVVLALVVREPTATAPTADQWPPAPIES